MGMAEEQSRRLELEARIAAAIAELKTLKVAAYMHSVIKTKRRVIEILEGTGELPKDS